MLSRAFADPKAAGQASRSLSAEGADRALAALDVSRFVFLHDNATLATSLEFADLATRDAAIERTRAALASLRETAD